MDAVRRDAALMTHVDNTASGDEQRPRVERLAYSLRDAAEALGVPWLTFRRWVYAGLIRSVKVRGRRLIPRSELEAIVARAKYGV